MAVDPRIVEMVGSMMKEEWEKNMDCMWKYNKENRARESARFEREWRREQEYMEAQVRLETSRWKGEPVYFPQIQSPIRIVPPMRPYRMRP